VAQNCFARSSVGLCLFYFVEALEIFLVDFSITVIFTQVPQGLPTTVRQLGEDGFCAVALCVGKPFLPNCLLAEVQI